MKKVFLVITLVMIIQHGFGQTTEAEKQLKTQKADSVLGWKKGGIINVNAAQTSLTNWAAGGQSSMAFSGLLSVYAHNKKEKSLWENYFDLGYGTMKQGKNGSWWKTDDRIELTSKYGIKATQKIYYAALLNFKTQMTDGFNYPNDSVKISGFLAPGYLLGAIGLDYIPGDNFAVFLAPLTLKMTLVKDDVLADAGAFGVDPGDHSRSEFGGYMRMFVKQNLMENITLQSKLDLFSNYLHNPQNIDVNWEVLLAMKVNDFISATFSTLLIYDDDVDIAIDDNEDGIIEKTGPRIQFKEILAVGLSWKF
jgi:hypothetical protein